MAQIHTLRISPPVINSSCAWASDFNQLRELYDSPHTGAVTTRTATIEGFAEDSSHTVAFTANGTTSINSYGYSPHPLTSYLQWSHTLLTTPDSSGSLPSKPIILSITASTAGELALMVQKVQELRIQLRSDITRDDKVSGDPSSLIAVELNTSCPNIKDKPPPAYHFPNLTPLLDVLAEAYRSDPTFTIGLKLPPYIYSTQFKEVVDGLANYTESPPQSTVRQNPFSFLTCTNTLGSSLLFIDQTSAAHSSTSDETSPFALPTALGGLAGDALHSLSLGNVHTFSQLLKTSDDLCLRNISIIGVGGVTNALAARHMRSAGAAVVGVATLLGCRGVDAFSILSSALQSE